MAKTKSKIINNKSKIKNKRRKAPRSPKDLHAIYRKLRKHFKHQNWWPGDTQLEISVGAMLTQNTAWTNVEKAIGNLKKEKVLNLNKLLSLKRKKLANTIRPAGYFNVKEKRLRNFLNFVATKYDGSFKKMFKTSTAKLREELLSVNGIGNETADSILLYAGGKKIFVVDAYTKRIFKRHGFLSGDETYDEIRILFENSLPKSVSLYNDYHAQIVNLGKDFCKPTPKCEHCPLSDDPHSES